MMTAFKPALIGLRVFQWLLVISELGLSAYNAYQATHARYCYYDIYDDYTCQTFSVPGQNSFLIFNCVWTIIILLVLSVATLFTNMNPFAIAILDGLTTIFWFSGAIAWAVLVAGLDVPLADAMIALGFLIFVSFLATFVINVMGALRSRNGNGAGPKFGAGPQQGPYPPATVSPQQAGFQQPAQPMQAYPQQQPMQGYPQQQQQQTYPQQQYPQPTMSPPPPQQQMAAPSPQQQQAYPQQPYPQQGQAQGPSTSYYNSQNPELAHT